MSKINFPINAKGVKIHQVIKIIKLEKSANLKKSAIEAACVGEWISKPFEEMQRVDQFQIDEMYAKLWVILNADDYPDFERIITVNGEEFGFVPNMEEISFAEFGDVETIGQPDEDGNGGGFEEAHRIMAILFRPIILRVGDRYSLGNYEEEDSEVFEKRARFFLKHATYYQAKGAMFFFIPFNRELMSSSSQYQEHQEILK